MPKKLILFDADETLWTSAGHDYISRVPSTFQSLALYTVERLADGKVFVLKKGVTEAFEALQAHATQLAVGVVSDNKPEPVKAALQLFGLWNDIDEQAFNVRLWDGYCPKHQMVQEILQRAIYSDSKPGDVYLVDDKDYSGEAAQIGIHFIRVDNETDLNAVAQQILSNIHED